MVNVVVKEFTDVVKKDKWVDLIDFSRVRQCLIFSYVDQREVLSDPFHELSVLLSDSLELRCVDRQTRTADYQTAEYFLKHMRLRAMRHL